MKYIMMMNTPRGTGDYQINNWSPDGLQGAHRVHAPLQHGAESSRRMGWRRRTDSARRSEARPCEKGWDAG